MELTPTSNPYLEFYRDFARKHPGELTAVLNPELSDEARSEMYAKLDMSVALKYSWAIPDERALQIIKYYGPIVEMGAGNGYWARLLQLRGVDVIAYDLDVAEDDHEENEKNLDRPIDADEALNIHCDDGQKINEIVEDEDEEVEMDQICWTEVLKGTPKDLRKHSDRALLLIYPDDFEDTYESMAFASLCNYSGDTVIYVGELFGHTLFLPDPWGRTASEEFQKHLVTVYHKVLQVPLPSWHSSIDTLTVWKRSKTSIIDGAIYAYIEDEERIDLVASSPSTRHLLQLGKAESEVMLEAKLKRKLRDKDNLEQTGLDEASTKIKTRKK